MTHSRLQTWSCTSQSQPFNAVRWTHQCRKPYFCLCKITPKAAEGGVRKPGKGTSAEEWVPRGNTAPKGNPEEAESAPENEGAAEPEVDAMDTEDQSEQEKEAAPLALFAVMTHANGCKLLLRLLAPEHTG